jgi:hypothetical protein
LERSFDGYKSEAEFEILAHLTSGAKREKFSRSQVLGKMVQSNEQLRGETGGQKHEAPDQLVICRVDDLCPHPSYVRHRITVSAAQLSALVEQGDLAFRDPLAITRDGTMLDGYARWELARLRGRPTLNCIQYEMTEAEALHWLLQRHRRSNGLNAFSRILLASELEAGFKEKARSNQRAGGQNKGSSNLAEAERLDVRSEIAQAAGVSVGNLSKVKQLMTSAHSELVEALRNGEIRIHRAWEWSKQSPENQIEALRFYRTKKGFHKTIKTLISRHRPRLPTVSDLASLVRLLSSLTSGELDSVNVFVVKTSGKAVYVTEELVHEIGSQEELAFTCATKSH